MGLSLADEGPFDFTDGRSTHTQGFEMTMGSTEVQVACTCSENAVTAEGAEDSQRGGIAVRFHHGGNRNARSLLLSPLAIASGSFRRG